MFITVRSHTDRFTWLKNWLTGTNEPYSVCLPPHLSSICLSVWHLISRYICAVYIIFQCYHDLRKRTYNKKFSTNVVLPLGYARGQSVDFERGINSYRSCSTAFKAHPPICSSQAHDLFRVVLVCLHKNSPWPRTWFSPHVPCYCMCHIVMFCIICWK